MELAVVLLLLGIILPMAFGLLTNTQHMESNVQTRVTADEEAQVIDDALSRQIHAADYPTGTGAGPAGAEFASGTADGNSIEFYAQMGDTLSGVDVPRQITISATQACTGCAYDNLIESYVEPSGTPSSISYSGTPSQYVLGTGVVVPSNPGTGCPSNSTAPLFEYFGTVNGVADTCLQTGSVNLTSSQYGQVTNITATLTTIDPMYPKSSMTATFSIQIPMPNVDYYVANNQQ